MKQCIVCNADISDRGNRAIRCKRCQYRKECMDRRSWWKKNKQRYKNRWLTRLGNPQQDNEILQFLRKKREGKKVLVYKPLPDSAFKHNNELHYQQERKSKRFKKSKD